MSEESKKQDQGCAALLVWIIGAPVALALISGGHGDWIVGAVAVVAIVVVAVVTIGSLF